MPLLPAALQYRGGLWLFTRKPVDEVSGAAAESAARGELVLAWRHSILSLQYSTLAWLPEHQYLHPVTLIFLIQALE